MDSSSSRTASFYTLSLSLAYWSGSLLICNQESLHMSWSILIYFWGLMASIISCSCEDRIEGHRYCVVISTYALVNYVFLFWRATWSMHVASTLLEVPHVCLLYAWVSHSRPETLKQRETNFATYRPVCASFAKPPLVRPNFSQPAVTPTIPRLGTSRPSHPTLCNVPGVLVVGHDELTFLPCSPQFFYTIQCNIAYADHFIHKCQPMPFIEWSKETSVWRKNPYTGSWEYIQLLKKTQDTHAYTQPCKISNA